MYCWLPEGSFMALNTAPSLLLKGSDVWAVGFDEVHRGYSRAPRLRGLQGWQTHSNSSVNPKTLASRPEIPDPILYST